MHHLSVSTTLLIAGYNKLTAYHEVMSQRHPQYTKAKPSLDIDASYIHHIYYSVN